MPESPSVARELVVHGRALRRLARDLVGRSDAEDLVQDTAVRALRSPPAEPEGLFAWLAAVMRRLAANRRRGDVRRQRRETENVSDGTVPSAEHEVMQRDHVRAVTEALWALPEPYKGTLLQRYFQDLSPSQIAERTATPLPTVKSRLQRGIEMLRANLERRDGRDWRAALLPAFGLPARLRWLPVLSVSSMSILGKVAALAACVIAALSLWGLAPGSAPPVPMAAVAEVAKEATVAKADDIATPEQREQVAAAPSGASDLQQPFAFELRFRIVDADGLPIAGAAAALAPRGCALCLSPPTDRDGRVTVTWRGRSPTLTMAVGQVDEGNHTALQLITVTAGQVAHVCFVAGLAPVPASVRLDSLGRQVVTLPTCSEARMDCRSCHVGMVAANVFEVNGLMRPGLHPDAVFGYQLETGPELEAFDNMTEGAEIAGAPDRRRSILGRVFGVDGQPLGGARVVARQGTIQASVSAKADGSFVLRCPSSLAGPVEIRAGGGPEGQAVRSVDVVGESTAGVDLLLQTGRTLRGSVRGIDGKNLNGARIEYVASPGEDGDVATVGPDGAFAFANLPAGPARLLVWGAAGEKLPIAEEPVVADAGEVVIDLRSRAGVSGRLRVSLPHRKADATGPLEVRAWQVQTGRGMFLDRREDGAFYAHGLAAGFYRIEVGAAGSGYQDLGQHWVDGLGLADLGAVQPSTPGRLLIEGAESLAALELYARGGDCDVRADEAVLKRPELSLPAGPWLAFWREEGVVVSREFTLVGGTTTTLRVGR